MGSKNASGVTYNEWRIESKGKCELREDRSFPSRTLRRHYSIAHRSGGSDYSDYGRHIGGVTPVKRCEPYVTHPGAKMKRRVGWANGLTESDFVLAAKIDVL